MKYSEFPAAESLLATSLSVKALIAEWEQSYDVAKIQGVPAFVVNGKYLIKTASITSPDSMVELIKELLAK